MVSRKLRIAIYLHPKRAYQIAHEAGLHPSLLSKLLRGIEKAKPYDPRILRVAEIVGIQPEDCFTPEPETSRSAQ